MHKGTDDQTFNPIIVAKQQNWVDDLDGASPETM